MAGLAHEQRSSIQLRWSACNGTPIYGYRYKGAGAYHIGLLAQDVEKTAPHAVIEVGGFKAVDYRAATEASRRLNGAAA